MKDKIIEFNKSGYFVGEFKDNDSLSNLNLSLKSILSKQLKPAYFLETKYPTTFDLRPNAYDYDPCILDIIFQNNIHTIIDSFTQKDMLVGHVQIRTAGAGQSYMPWHRDVYATQERNVGMYPPAVKLIYYLSSKDKFETKLELLEGSHKLTLNHMPESDYIMPGFSKFDNQLFNICPKIQYKNENSRFLLFDTSMLHSVSVSSYESVRIIYSFATAAQIADTFKKGDHVKLSQIYRDMKCKR